MISATRNAALDRDALATLRDLGAPAITASATDTALPIYDVGADGQVISRLPLVFSIAVTVPRVVLGTGAHVVIKALVDDDTGLANAPAEVGVAVITGPGAYMITCGLSATELSRGQTHGLYLATRCEITGGPATVYYSSHIVADLTRR